MSRWRNSWPTSEWQSASFRLSRRMSPIIIFRSGFHVERSLPTLNRSPNRLEVTALILAVHAWPARRTHARAHRHYLSYFFPPFFSISSTSLTSEFALSALHVARIMRTGNYGDARAPLPPPPYSPLYALLFPSLSGCARCLPSGRRGYRVVDIELNGERCVASRRRYVIRISAVFRTRSDAPRQMALRAGVEFRQKLPSRSETTLHAVISIADFYVIKGLWERKTWNLSAIYSILRSS